MSEAEKSFFEENDEKVSRRQCKILLWMTLVFPVVWLLKVVGIFAVSTDTLKVIVPLGCTITLAPTILNKFIEIPSKFTKYYSSLAVGLIIAMLASDYHLGIYMTYALAMAMSCMYFDKQFTLKIGICSYFFMLLGLFLRSFSDPRLDGSSPTKYFISYGMGFTLEFVVMLLIFIAISDMARQLLISLKDTEKIKQVVENCEEASIKLSGVVEEVMEAIDSSIDGNNEIASSAKSTLSDCSTNLEHVKNTEIKINGMSDKIKHISFATDNMSEITNNTYQSTKDYINIMDGAVNYIKNIEKSTKNTRMSVEALQERSKDIVSFTETITEIASRTKMLALNASIEAARAGENGKGFAVVAEQVGDLAKESTEAAINITQQVDLILENVSKAEESVVINENSVDLGMENMIKAKQEAEKLLDYQLECKDKVKVISEQCCESQKYEHEVNEMAEKMSELVNNSLEQVQSIADAINIQLELMGNVQNSFKTLKNISDDLNEISIIK